MSTPPEFTPGDTVRIRATGRLALIDTWVIRSGLIRWRLYGVPDREYATSELELKAGIRG